MEKEVSYKEIKDTISVLTSVIFAYGPGPTYNPEAKKEAVQHLNWLVLKYNNTIRRNPDGVFLNVYKYRVKEDQIFEIISEQNQILMAQDKIKEEIGI